MIRLLSLLLLLTAPLLAQTVIGNTAGVQILRARRLDADEKHYGYDYSARNRNDYPVYVSIRLTNAVNAYDGLLPGSVIVQGGENASLGYVVQEDASSDSNWDLEWKAEPLSP
jgi:hypothetical protein